MSKKNRIKKPLGPRCICPVCNYGNEIDPKTGKVHNWHSRVENPVQCPRCKRYLRSSPIIVDPPKLPEAAEPFFQALSPQVNQQK